MNKNDKKYFYGGNSKKQYRMVQNQWRSVYCAVHGHRFLAHYERSYCRLYEVETRHTVDAFSSTDKSAEMKAVTFYLFIYFAEGIHCIYIEA